MKCRLIGLLAGCVMLASMAHAATISGTAFYRERIGAPPGARFVAVLRDTSRADAPAIALGRVEIANAGNPPYAFEITYDADTIKPNHTYGVRALLLSADGRLLFTTDTRTPVITRGAPTRVEIVLKRVASSPDPASSPTGAHGLRLPASFKGTLPCGNCAGVAHHLDLWPDQTYHMRRVYIGMDDWRDGDRGSDRDYWRDELGHWYADPARDEIVLFGASEMPLRWQVIGPHRLRQMDIEGNPIESDLNHALTSDGSLRPTDLERTFLLGRMSLEANATRFAECVTGRTYLIAQDGEYDALERAYLAGTDAPREPLIVHVEGDLVMHPAMDGPESGRLVVDRFIATRPGVTCERQRAKAHLVNTYWRIDRLRGEEVAGLVDRREPHLVLLNDPAPRYRATVGCNRLSGDYVRQRDRLTFGPAAGTRMACAAPLDGMENTLAQTLGAVRAYRTTGDSLTLLDKEGEIVALLTAVYFR